MAISVPPWERGGIEKAIEAICAILTGAESCQARETDRRQGDLPHVTAPGQEVEVFGDGGEGDGRVEAREGVADLRDAAAAVGEVERLVGEHVAVVGGWPARSS